MEKKIRIIKTAIIAVLALVVVIGFVGSKFKKSETKENAITFYSDENTAKETKEKDNIKENTEYKTVSDTDVEIEQNTSEIGDIAGKISINKAGLSELMTLKGIGETKAKAIIEYRDKYNGFVNIEEIMQVKGIGEGTFNKLKDQICL